MRWKSGVGVVALVVASLAVGYAAGKIKSAQEAKEKLFNAMVVMGKGEKMSDAEAAKMMSDLQDVSEFLWDKVLTNPDTVSEQDIAVLCSNEALQVALTLGMVSSTDLFKNAVKKAGEENSPDPDKLAEAMGAVAGFLLSVADPQLWEAKMGKTEK